MYNVAGIETVFSYPWIRNDARRLYLDNLLRELDGADPYIYRSRVHAFQYARLDHAHRIPGVCFGSNGLLGEEVIVSRYTISKVQISRYPLKLEGGTSVRAETLMFGPRLYGKQSSEQAGNLHGPE